MVLLKAPSKPAFGVTTMPPLTESDKSEAIELIQKHIPGKLFNVSKHEESVTVQFHDMPDGFGDMLVDLHDHSYSYSVDSAWEAPPKVRIDRRDYYEEV